MVSLASTFGRRFWLLVAVLPALALSAMSDFFTVHSSCNTGDVNNLLDDAVDLLDRTLEALTVLKSTGGFFSAGSEKRNYMRNMHDTYGTSYYNIFSKSLSDVDMAVVDGRMAWYQKIRDSLTPGHPSALKPSKAYLVCGGETPGPWVETSNPHDLHPMFDDYPAGNEPAFTRLIQRGVGFAWYIPGIRDSMDYARLVHFPSLVNGEYQYGGEHDCSAAQGPLACVNLEPSINDQDKDFRVMLLCGKLWDTKQTVVNLRDARTRPKDAPSKTGQPSDNLDDYVSRPGVFIHEMSHFLGGPAWDDEEFQYAPSGSDSERTVRPYGVVAIDLLANRRGQLSGITKADRYAYPDMVMLFAEASYVKGKKWNPSKGTLFPGRRSLPSSKPKSRRQRF